MLNVSPNAQEPTRLEKKLIQILEPKDKMTAAQIKKSWEAIDGWLEERRAEEDSYVTGALFKTAIDPGHSMHPDVLHDGVCVLLKGLYRLKMTCPEIYERRITEQFLLQVLWADVLSLHDEDADYTSVGKKNTEKLSLTPKKLELLERGFTDGSMAWRMAVRYQGSLGGNPYLNSVLVSETEAFFDRWKELSGRKLELEADAGLQENLIRVFTPDEWEPPYPLYGGFPRQPPSEGRSRETLRMKDMIGSVDHFVKKTLSPELARFIVGKKNMEMTVMALNNNLISSAKEEIEAAVEAAREHDETKVIPMLIRKRWEEE